jgi:hypothetical protein
MPHSIQWAHVGDSSYAGQSASDVITWATVPAGLLSGRFTIHYIPDDDSAYANKRVLLSAQTTDGVLSYEIYRPDGACVGALINGVPFAEVSPITFAIGAKLSFTFDATAGSCTVAGASTGNGTSYGLRWDPTASGGARLGGTISGANVARGYVSLPYAESITRPRVYGNGVAMLSNGRRVYA